MSYQEEERERIEAEYAERVKAQVDRDAVQLSILQNLKAILETMKRIEETINVHPSWEWENRR